MSARWSATVYYRHDSGLVDVDHDVEELSDIDELVERGPHWDTIDRIVIRRSRGVIAGLTVETAASL